MKFTQYYLDCLSQASYLIGDETTGRAVVVDPRRDIDEYIDDARAAGLTIELVLETHFHADFLSGHLELAAATGAEIAYSSVADTEFESRKLVDGERIELGDVVLEIRHTPGHTPESISIVVWEHPDDSTPYGVLTGDTLFIGDVGRPDPVVVDRVHPRRTRRQPLRQPARTTPDLARRDPRLPRPRCRLGVRQEPLDRHLVDDRRSTRNELRPARGEQTVVLRPRDRGAAAGSGVFLYNAVLNRKDRDLLDERGAPPALTLDRVDELVANGAFVLDGRDPEAFAHGHLAGSINVGLDGRYAEFAGSVIPSDVDIVLVTEEGTELEAKNRLGRIGFDRVVGYLGSPHVVMAEHPQRVRRGSRLTAHDFDSRRDEIAGLQLVDIRNPGEVRLGNIAGAVSIPVGQLPGRLDELDPTAPTVVYCAGGYRSSVAASVLRHAGFDDVSDVIGGYGAWVLAQTTPLHTTTA